LVIDDEWLNCINRVLKSFDVNEDLMALDMIKRVGIGGHFLREGHTLKYMRNEIWYPHLFNRKDWSGWAREGHPDLLKKSQGVVDKILKENYPPSPLIGRDLMHDLLDIERNATKDLVEHH